MANYLFAFHQGPNPDKPGPEVMEKWMTWFKDMGDAVVNMGAPLGPSKTVASSGTSDGGGANPLSGYTVVKADSIEAACKMAEGCPGLESGGSVEVAECIEM
ncbi:MAG: hypothetical protein GY798_01055 [Hyphomicrobiales bacterium]|nr:hypothetical protein [Hyphomicrobiales bacterium]